MRPFFGALLLISIIFSREIESSKRRENVWIDLTSSPENEKDSTAHELASQLNSLSPVEAFYGDYGRQTVVPASPLHDTYQEHPSQQKSHKSLRKARKGKTQKPQNHLIDLTSSPENDKYLTAHELASQLNSLSPVEAFYGGDYNTKNGKTKKTDLTAHELASELNRLSPVEAFYGGDYHTKKGKMKQTDSTAHGLARHLNRLNSVEHLYGGDYRHHTYMPTTSAHHTYQEYQTPPKPLNSPEFHGNHEISGYLNATPRVVSSQAFGNRNLRMGHTPASQYANGARIL